MQAIPKTLGSWLLEQGYGAPTEVSALAGGCINQVCRLWFADGRTLVGKWNPQEIPGIYAAEAAGLDALRVDGGPTIPEVLAHDKAWLLLADLGRAGKRKNHWSEFGEQLATMHLGSHEKRFGFAIDNHIGATEQPNPWCDNGIAFFAEHRLGFQGDLAVKRGLLATNHRKDLDSLITRLPELLPPMPSAIIHGDLWSGNAAVNPQGGPALIDPATHHGWAEAELAMTTLFGGFPAEFYEAYEDANPAVKGWRQRVPLYNLYHLLNHLNLFGSGYLGECLGIISRFRS